MLPNKWRATKPISCDEKNRLSQIVSLQTELLFCLITTECNIVFTSINPDNLRRAFQMSIVVSGRRGGGRGRNCNVECIFFFFWYLDIKCRLVHILCQDWKCLWMSMLCVCALGGGRTLFESAAETAVAKEIKKKRPSLPLSADTGNCRPDCVKN